MINSGVVNILNGFITWENWGGGNNYHKDTIQIRLNNIVNKNFVKIFQ